MRATARIFLLDDEELVVTMLARSLKGEGYDVRWATDPTGAVEAIQAFRPDVVLLDLKLPGTDGLEILARLQAQGSATQVVMLTSDARAESAVRAMKMGAAHYFTKPFDLDEVKLMLASIVEKAQLKQEVEYLRRVAGGEGWRGELIGASEPVRLLREQAAKLARAGVPLVLITGENGTGKEVLARHMHHAMHEGTEERPSPFIGVNCAALPDQLIESELFGHEKGAYTDAHSDRKGVFELGAGGSVLLDEIGEMRWDLQAKLLRVVEEWRFRRIGGTHELPVQATVFATTNRDLPQAVKDGKFRIDLFYRFATFSLHIPPLRERPQDIVPLAHHFIETYCARYRRPALKGFSPEAEQLLLGYGWPGNVRELRNVVERIVVLEVGSTVLPDHLPKEILFPPRRQAATEEAEPEARCSFSAVGPGTPPPFDLPEGGLSMEDLESTLIVQALARTGRNKAQAAKLLGISYDSLRYQMKKFGL
jgi:DNA-binding NtrC family response regulator